MKLNIENKLWEKGYKNIAFCDEVGRGCLFGPVLAASVILPRGFKIDGIKDSKKLSPKKRRIFFELIKEKAIAIGIGMKSSKVIDTINIKKATKLAMKESIENLKDKEGNKILADFILIDAETIEIDIPQKSIIKGDDLVHGIAAASIVAKETRDGLCISKWENQYPGYGIGRHKGYPTREHKEALKKYGLTEQHRRTFIRDI